MVFCRKSGYRTELAWTCSDYAEVLLSGGRPGDLQTANTMLEESLSLSTELGMPLLIERVVALQETVKNMPDRGPNYPDGLSQREVEVLALIAIGKSNREIAEDLVISPNTVGHLVSNILSKIRAFNRTEAAAYANREDLVYPGDSTKPGDKWLRSLRIKRSLYLVPAVGQFPGTNK